MQRAHAAAEQQAVESWVPDGGVVPSIHGAGAGAGGAAHAQGGWGVADADGAADPQGHGHGHGLGRGMAHQGYAPGQGQAWSMDAGADEAPSTPQIRAQVVAQSLASGHRLRYRDLVHPQLRAWRERQHGGGRDSDAPRLAQAPAFDALRSEAPLPPEWGAANLREDAGASARVLATSDLLDVASLLQRHDGAAYARVLGGETQGPLADVIRHEILSGVRQIGFDPARTRFSIDEEDAIDLVGILFESLFQANDLVHPARGIYENIQERSMIANDNRRFIKRSFAINNPLLQITHH